jgi:hypothetical protein
VSAFLYGRFEGKREEAARGTSMSEEPPGLKTYADTLAALVPAEVLAAAIFFVSEFTETTTGPDGKDVITVTEPTALKWSWYGCIAFAALFYIAGHIRVGARSDLWDRWDFARMLIPAGAFVAWTAAVEPATMLNAAWGLDRGWRILLAVFGAVCLGLAASALAYKADRKPPPS